MNDDPRVRCMTCRHLVNKWCQRARAAGLSRTRASVEIGRTFATMLQRCSAHHPSGAKWQQ